MKIAELNSGDLEKIKSLEQEFGAQIVALEPAEHIAELSDVELARLQEVEDELGVILVALKGT